MIHDQNMQIHSYTQRPILNEIAEIKLKQNIIESIVENLNTKLTKHYYDTLKHPRSNPNNQMLKAQTPPKEKAHKLTQTHKEPSSLQAAKYREQSGSENYPTNNIQEDSQHFFRGSAYLRSRYI